VKVYVSLDDWFRITKYPGVDPETNSDTNSGTGMSMAVDRISYPTQKSALLGINITL
jgi:hypothetical protein